MATEQKFRQEVKRELNKAIKERSLSKKKAAEILNVTRQSLDLYLKGRVTPRPHVLYRACEAWNLKFEFRDRFFSVLDFKPAAGPRPAPPKQLSLFEALNGLEGNDLKISIVRQEPRALELRVRIEFAS